MGIDEENSHTEEYIKYMDAVLEQDKWEKECAERNEKNVKSNLKEMTEF